MGSKVGQQTAELLGVDAVAVGTRFGLLAGVISVVAPFFQGLTVALAALVAVAWLTRFPPRHLLRGTPLLGVLSIAGGWGAFLSPLPFPWPIRSVLLGASLLPLWWTGRRANAPAWEATK